MKKEFSKQIGQGYCWAHFDLCTHILGAAGGMEREGRNCGPKYGYLKQSAPSKDLLSTLLRSGCSHLVFVRNDQNSQNSAWFYSKILFSDTGSPKLTVLPQMNISKKSIENGRFCTLNMK